MGRIENLWEMIEMEKPENTAFSGFLTDFNYLTSGPDGTVFDNLNNSLSTTYL
jgi:hypothetical protein